MPAKGENLYRVGLAVVLLFMVVLACCPTPGDGAVSVVIVSPGDGGTVVVGQEVMIDSTITAADGVDRVDLSVDGDIVRHDTPPEGKPTTFRVSQLWTPTSEGLARVSVVAYDVNEASDEATITLQVVASAAGGGSDASAVPPTEQGATATVTPTQPTETPLPPVTTDAGCTLDSQYVADVTVPDGTVMSPGQAFVKKWQVKNPGTCDWGAGFQLVFVSGAQMDGPASVPLPAVPAGGETEVSVNQTAPSAYGTHKGTWRIEATDGTPFGVNLTVVIVVPAPVTDTPEPPPATDTPEPTVTDTPEPTTDTEEVTLSPSSVGSVVEQIGVGSGCHVGDTAINLGQQCFVTFDVSAIPDSATVERAELRFSSVTETGDPFGDLGDLDVYHHDYGDLDIGDWKVMGNSGDVIVDTFHKKSDFKHPRVLNPRGETGLQDSLASDRFQIRFQFMFSDGDGYSDVDVVSIPGIQLWVRYRP